jgi:hypothetical protein
MLQSTCRTVLILSALSLPAAAQNATNTVIANVTVGTDPIGAAVTPDGSGLRQQH